MVNQIKILTRQSTLAKIQGKIVGDKIYAAFPQIKIKYYTSKTIGDINQNLDIKSSETRGLFTSDISKNITNGLYDIAVHSWKDYPILNKSNSDIVGTVLREDSRDIIFIKKSSVDKNNPKILSIMTSSPRRRYGLEKRLNRIIPIDIKKLEFRDLRGNIETRLNKFIESDNDAIIVAKAAIDRLLASDDVNVSFKTRIQYCFSSCQWIILPLSLFPTAAAQGAIGIETRADNTKILEVISKINNKVDYEDVQIERGIISTFGGGCSQKIGISIIRKNKKVIESLFGLTEEGERLNFYGEIKNGTNTKGKNKVLRKKIFPQNKKEESIFKRVNFNKNEKIKSLKQSIIFITRKNVLKFKPIFNNSCILWTSGVKTWEAIVKQGYWVNGSSESLGENELEKIFNLFNKKYSVFKLTFEDKSNDPNKVIETYKLEKPEFPISFANRTHFYWMSSKLFKVAIKKYPQIIEMDHSCGMGNTYIKLKEVLGDRLNCFLSYEDWFKNICKHEK